MSNKNETARIRYQLYRDMGYSVKEAQRLRWHDDIALEDVRNINTEAPTRNELIRQRYQSLRKQGYSVKDAQKLRYRGIKRIKRKRIIKDKTYHYFKHEYSIDTVMQEMRRYENDTTMHDHGFYSHTNYLKGNYADMVQRIRDENNLSDKQAWYVAYYMTESKKSYHETMNELRSNALFEKYKSHKRG